MLTYSKGFVLAVTVICAFFSEAEVMSEKIVTNEPRPFIMNTVSNQWTSGICDCFHDLPQCMCTSLFLCNLTRRTYFTVRDKERHNGQFLIYKLRQEVAILNPSLVHEVVNMLIIPTDLASGRATDGRLEISGCNEVFVHYHSWCSLW